MATEPSQPNAQREPEPGRPCLFMNCAGQPMGMLPVSDKVMALAMPIRADLLLDDNGNPGAPGQKVLVKFHRHVFHYPVGMIATPTKPRPTKACCLFIQDQWTNWRVNPAPPN